MIPAVELSQVSVSRGGKPIIAGLSLRIASGEWYGLVGANGSGKTTLLRALAGRLPFRSGECLVNGGAMQDQRVDRARSIGFAPPIERLPDSLHVSQLLELAGDPIELQKARNAELWEALDLATLLDRKARELSSGMLQRTAIAIAFSYEAPIVILDEPFNWLDPVAAMDTRNALARMTSGGMTLITALHDMTTLCGFCDAGGLMSEGRLTLELSGDDLAIGRKDPLAFERWVIEKLK